MNFEATSHSKNYPTLLIIIYTIAVAFSISMTNKIINYDGLYFSGCLITFPLLYLLGDITAEVFGYRFAKKLLWQVLFGGLVFSVLTYYTIKLPSPSFYNNSSSYIAVFGLNIRFVLVGMLAIWLGGIINSYIIAKTKIIFIGKYFWLRSILSTCIGEFVNSLVAFPLAFGGILTHQQIFNMVITSYIFKTLYAVISVYPASLIVKYYKVIKKIDTYEKGIQFNPFK